MANAACSAQDARDAIVLKPGQDLQAIVRKAAEGTRFHFDPGVYRQRTILPKDGQQFIGQEGVVFNGAMVLQDWTEKDGLWLTDGLPQPMVVVGSCIDGTENCTMREDLFVDDKVYTRVQSREDLDQGTWLYEDNQAYLAENPEGRLVELGVTPLAFGGGASDVVLENLTVEKYASAAQRGAIDLRDTRGWRLASVALRWNHGVGLYLGNETHVKGGTFNHNGQLGIGGGGENSIIEGVEIAFNNYAGFRPGWEAGGTKFHRSNGLIVRDSCVHNNKGPGLWTDIDNINTLYEGNTVFLNANDGIKHEISYKAVIRDNISLKNGKDHYSWLWGAQILVQNSRDVEIYDNHVEVADAYGNGISVVHQDRGDVGDGKHGEWDAVDNRVYGNTIVYLGDRGTSGVARDVDEDWFWEKAGNSFEKNTYVVPEEGGSHWEFDDGRQNWSEVKGLGYEADGELVVERRPPLDLSCDFGDRNGASGHR